MIPYDLILEQEIKHLTIVKKLQLNAYLLSENMLKETPTMCKETIRNSQNA